MHLIKVLPAFIRSRWGITPWRDSRRLAALNVGRSHSSREGVNGQRTTVCAPDTRDPATEVQPGAPTLADEFNPYGADNVVGHGLDDSDDDDTVFR
jgi:hypothetical protein